MEMMANDESYEAQAAPPALELRGRQLALHKALGEFHSPLADWYAGTLIVLNAAGPDRLALAAHNIREIIEYLPRREDLPMASANTGLGSKATNLRERWVAALTKTTCYEDGKWVGSVDTHLSNLLNDVEEFFEWVEAQRPTKRVLAARLVKAMDAVPLPDVLVQQNANWYLEMRDFFVSVAHHRDCDESEFEKWVNAFEVFLLDRLSPRTYEEFDEIDEIISGGPSADA